MERITGANFINANKKSISAAKESWDMFFDDLLNRFLVQGPLKKIFTNAYYDFSSDKLIIKNTLDDIISNTKKVARSIDPEDSDNYISYVKRIIKLNKSAFNDVDFDKKIEEILP